MRHYSTVLAKLYNINSPAHPPPPPTPTSLFNDDKNINVKIVPKAEENLTVVKKKKRRKSSLISAKDINKTPKNVAVMVAQQEEGKYADNVFDKADPDVDGVETPKHKVQSKKTAMFGVSEKGRNLVGIEGMSAENSNKVKAYQDRMKAEAEGRPNEVQEKVIRKKQVRSDDLGMR